MSKEEKVTPSAPEPTPADDDAGMRLQINLRLKLDEIAEIEATSLRVNDWDPPTRDELCELACRMYDARRTRDKMLDRELFGEPAWDMLLALYCLPTRGVQMSVTGLTYSAGVPQATGHRWQTILYKEGLIERLPQGSDRRRHALALTAKGRSLMDAYLRRLYHLEARTRRDPPAE